MVSYDVAQTMSSVLTAPEKGDIELDIDRDDPKFNTLNNGIETATEFYSEAQKLVGRLGVPFPGPQIQQTDAVELFVEPFSGDWNEIVACGDAMKKAGKGLVAIAGNLSFGMVQLFEATDGWKGDTATAFQAHMGVHAGVYVGAGLVVEQGQVVFDGISEVAQFIAGLVVELIDTALDIAVWLIDKFVRYAKPWIGWAMLAYDVVTDGWDQIQDTIDTLQALYDTITAIFDLHDAVKDWVETIPAELAVFSDLIAIVKDVPKLADTPILTAAQIRNDMNGVGSRSAELLEEREKAEEALDDAEQRLDDLAEDLTEPEVPDGISDVDPPEFEDP